MIEKLISNTLELAGVPVFFMHCNKQSDQYITWSIPLEQGDNYSDDNEQVIEYYIQVNIFSKTNYFVLKETVKTVMKQAGFTIRDDRDGYFDNATNYYNRVQRYYYFKEV